MKKKLLFVMMALASSFTAFAQVNEEEQNLDVNEDVTDVVSLDDIIQGETTLSKYKGDEEHYKKVWGRNTFFNISYNQTDMTGKNSTDPVSLPGYAADLDLKKNFGVGLQWGHSYNFHKKAIGDVLFIGLDYSWLDLNLNRFDKQDLAEKQITFVDHENDKLNMPFHNNMWEVDYGMSIGPSLTFYPFTAIHKNGTDNIRLQFYYHIGYSASMMLIEDCLEDLYDSEEEALGMAWGHGMFTSFGGNLTWRNIGVGYEVRNLDKFKYKTLISHYDKDIENEFSQKTTRIYLQFRF